MLRNEIARQSAEIAEKNAEINKLEGAIQSLTCYGPYSQTLSEEYFRDKEKLKIFLRKFEDLNLQ